MRATFRPSTDGHAQVRRSLAALESRPAPPPLIRLFPRDASPAEPAAPSLPRVGEPASQGVGSEVWYAVFLSAFLVSASSKEGQLETHAPIAVS